MFRLKLYILLFLTSSIKCVFLKQFKNCKIPISFINNPFYSKDSLYSKNFYNNYYNEKYQNKYNKNKYTLNNKFVLYARKSKEDKNEPKSVKGATRRAKKKLELALEPEPIQEDELPISTDLEDDSDLNMDVKPENPQSLLDLNSSDGELSISNRMLTSVLSLTSSVTSIDLYDIIPILYNIKDEILNITENMKDQFEQNNKVSDKKNKITGLFVDNDEGNIDRLLISIPSSILNRLSQSSKYGTKVESTESPLQIISLGPGFFSKAYHMAIFPYLSEVSQKAFNCKLDHYNGFMEYIVSAPTDNKNYKENDFRELKQIEKEEFETAFKYYRVHRNQDFDISLLKESTLKSLSILIKCIKDFVYFNSCISLLEKLLGRKPTDNEILYSFQLDPLKDNTHSNNNSNLINTKDNKEYKNKDNKNSQYKKQMASNYNKEMRDKLVDIITYSEDEIEYRLDRFFTPFLEVAIDRFEEKVVKRSYYLRMLFGCLNDSIKGIRFKLYGIYPNTILNLGNNFIGELFKIGYNHVRISAIKQNLPMHLPLATLRLAKKAFAVYEDLRYLQYDSIMKFKDKLIDPKNLPSIDTFYNDKYLNKENDKVDKDDKKNRENNEKDNKYRKDIKDTRRKDKYKVDLSEELYKEFLSGIYKIEARFKNKRGNKETNEMMRKQQQDKLLDEMVAKVLKVSVDRVKESIDAYYTKEVSLRDRIPKHLRMKFARSNLLYSNTGTYSDLTQLKIYDEKEDMDLLKEKVYKKTLRKLAIEAIDDRLTRLLYMSYNDLFLEINPEYEEVIEKLEIPKKTADFIVFTGSLICREYEVWRIKLNLPPYVNEFTVNPGILRKVNLDPDNLPYHISIAVYNNLKRHIQSSGIEDYRTPVVTKSHKKDKRDTYNRKRLIKPNMSSVNDLLMNYKENYKEYENILKRSPIEYLKPTGIYDE